MFNALKSDVPYTKPAAATPASSAPASTPAAPATSPAAVNEAQVHVAVQNGSGTTGRAKALADALAADGFSSSRITTGNAAPTGTTALYYPPPAPTPQPPSPRR